MDWWGWLLVSPLIAAAIHAAFVGWLYARGRREDARAMATFIPDCNGVRPPPIDLDEPSVA